MYGHCTRVRYGAVWSMRSTMARKARKRHMEEVEETQKKKNKRRGKEGAWFCPTVEGMQIELAKGEGAIIGEG